jgi:hypothetical protein
MLFQTSGILPVGGYLPGVAQWPHAVTLTRARVMVERPVAAETNFWLEVNGVLTGSRIVIPAGGNGGGIIFSEPVAPGAVVRWQCQFAGDAYYAPAGVELSLDWLPVASPVPQTFSLVWLSGPERFALFRYDTGTCQFTDVSGGLSVGRASLDASDGLSVSIRGVEALRLRGGQARARCWSEEPAPSAGDRLQFVVNGVPWLTVTAGAVYAGSLIETPALPSPPSAFVQPGAVVAADGFYALDIEEGLP